MYKAILLTISDKGAAGLREDTAGPAVQAMLEERGNYKIIATTIIPDEQPQIELAIIDAADGAQADLVLTIGGTGFAPRDVTPEATRSVCNRLVPGIPEAMRASSMRVTNRAMLSRMVAGIRGQTLVINLPGSQKAATENLSAVIDALDHGLDMLLALKNECAAPQE